eukprot:CAMPEP_0179181036 /NCGR_PEP_ID=MMETSP0796-20121207/89648_1 /TAXON_ID=73915 /ORGANISM="Pyrodinium bahamense, Strain pbaha01" /LENGTH=106 /DNA_ID=CAMNT_0020884785 /DNA_START=485 /DNA_END=807 /DNA_ORIENTATION=+
MTAATAGIPPEVVAFREAGIEGVLANGNAHVRSYQWGEDFGVAAARLARVHIPAPLLTRPVVVPKAVVEVYVIDNVLEVLWAASRIDANHRAPSAPGRSQKNKWNA